MEIEENEYGNIRILDLYKPSHAEKRAVIFTMTLQTHNLSEYALTCQFMKYLDLLIKSTLKFGHFRSSSKDYFEIFAVKINKYGLISSM